jgi:NAD(P)-dependent dehydrogenase (short-subunit alcohol dehydrogenase family)
MNDRAETPHAPEGTVMTTSVLITGTSSGVGRATALLLARRPELTVYATARRSETLTDLADAGARILPLDVTDETSMKQAVEAVEAEHGSVGVLVNNAGYGEYGTARQRRTRGIPSPIHEMISRWISLLPPPKVKITADR